MNMKMERLAKMPPTLPKTKVLAVRLYPYQVDELEKLRQLTGLENFSETIRLIVGVCGSSNNVQDILQNVAERQRGE